MERIAEEIRSKRNRLFWRMRETFRFRRAGYKETEEKNTDLDPQAEALAEEYGLHEAKKALSFPVYQKNCATLFILEKMLGDLPLNSGQTLEPGCQDFARLPAIRAYLTKRGIDLSIVGVEVDAYPLLNNLHSRADKAAYYLSLPPGQGRDRFEAADFFQWQDPAALVLCFYPFVSTHPTLAWGLPKEFGKPMGWVDAFVRNLLPGGLAMIVHQGPWEEEEFDKARAGSKLKLLKRANVDCPFYPLPHPACASIYTLET